MIYQQRAFILVVFLCFEITKLISSFLDPDEPYEAMIARILQVAVYFIISYYAYISKKVALWIISIILLLSGLGNLIGAFSALFVNKGNIEVTLTCILFGGYFVYGCMKLLGEVRLQNRVGSDEK